MTAVSTAPAALDRRLGDEKVRDGARRDLRCVGDGQHLHLRREPRQADADRVGNRPADRRVDLVEDQRRRRAAVGERHLEGEEKAGEFAARGDLHHRPRLAPRIGPDQKGDVVDAGGGSPRRIAAEGHGKLRPFELQRRQLGLDRFLEVACGEPPFAAEFRRPRVIAGFPGDHRLFEPRQALLARFERGEFPGHALGDRRQVGNRDSVFAGGGAERKEPLLRAFEFARIGFGRRCGDFECPPRVVERRQGPVDRRDRIIEEAARLVGLALETPDETGERRRRRRRAGDDLVGLGDVAGDLFRPHQALSEIGELILLAGLWRQPCEFVDRCAEIARLGFGRRDPLAEVGHRSLGVAPGLIGFADRGGLAFETAESIEQRPVGAGVDHGAVVMLAVNLDQHSRRLRGAASPRPADR